MRTIGLLHGMSSAATGDYYRRINDGVNAALGGHERAQMLVWSVNFGDVERFVRGDRWEAAADYLVDKALRLERAGADFLVCGSNTMHRVAPAIEAATEVPFLHIVDVLADAALRGGARTLGVLGTRPTMEAAFYAERLALHGIAAIVPDADDRDLVDRVIFDELTRHELRDDSKAEYIRVITGLAEAGADAVVLGCTEIGLLVDQSDVPDIPLLDTTELHVERIVRFALE
ncbi:aspartate/glutamate racemase family protein [Actinomycetes bacterium KLBMP 9759]